MRKNRPENREVSSHFVCTEMHSRDSDLGQQAVALFRSWPSCSIARVNQPPLDKRIENKAICFRFCDIVRWKKKSQFNCVCWFIDFNLASLANGRILSASEFKVRDGAKSTCQFSCIFANIFRDRMCRKKCADPWKSFCFTQKVDPIETSASETGIWMIMFRRCSAIWTNPGGHVPDPLRTFPSGSQATRSRTVKAIQVSRLYPWHLSVLPSNWKSRWRFHVQNEAHVATLRHYRRLHFWNEPGQDWR